MYRPARRAKHVLLGRSVAEFARQYQQLPAYLARFSATNPFTTYCLLVDEETQRFKRVFIYRLASSISFGPMRGIVAVDGTFLKGSFVHTLLLAVGFDAEEHIATITWAIVEGENESSRKWFFSQLKDGLPDLNCEDITIISDRDKGLRAAENDLEYATHVFCVQHLAENIRSRFGMELRRKFIALTYAGTK